MNMLKKILGLAGVGVALMVTVAQAQLGFDTFNPTRTYVLAPPTDIGPSVGIVTNPVFDSLSPIGVGSIDLFVNTNSGTAGGTLTLALQGSTDQTNWVSLTNMAVISTYYTLTITNGYFGGTNLTATDSILLPGTYTTPTPSIAGFVTPYLTKLPFTNGSPLTVSASGYYKIGINVKDQLRYLRTVWTPGGTVTNFTVGATMTTAVQ